MPLEMMWIAVVLVVALGTLLAAIVQPAPSAQKAESRTRASRR